MKYIYKALLATILSCFSAFALATSSECPSDAFLKNAQLIDGKTRGMDYGYVSSLSDNKGRNWSIFLTLENKNLSVNDAQSYFSTMPMQLIAATNNPGSIMCIYIDTANPNNELMVTTQNT